MNSRYKKAAAVLGAAAFLAAAAPALAADPPAVTITSGPADNSTVSTSSVSFEFVATNASSTNCALSGAGSPGDPYACSSPQSFTLPDGSYTFTVEAQAGTSTASAQRLFTIDTADDTDEGPITAPPAITITSGPEEGGTVSGDTVTFEFSVTHASSTRCALAGIDATSTNPYACSSPQSFTLPEGSYRFSIEAGNPLGTSSVSRAFSMAASDVSDDGDGGGGGGGSRGGGGFRRYNTPVVVTGAIIAGEGGGASGNIGGAGDLSDFPLVITPLAPITTGSDTRGANVGAGRSLGGRVAVTPASAQVGGVVQTDENIAPTTTATTAPSAIGTTTATGTLGAAAAAAAGSAGTVPGWVWFVLAIVLLGALLYWAYRSSVGYESTTRR